MEHSYENIRKPFLVCIEGLDGSGKTIQANMLADYLKRLSKSVILLDFPQYDSFFGKEIGAYLSGRNKLDAAHLDVKSMSLWYAMDRWTKLNDTAWRDYDFVILNRFTLSNAVYQSTRVPDDLSDEIISWIFDLEHNKLFIPIPNLYIFLDVPIDISQKLNRQKDLRDYIGNESDVYERNILFQEKVRDAYLQMKKKLNNFEIITCIENSLLLSPDAILLKILEKLDL